MTKITNAYTVSSGKIKNTDASKPNTGEMAALRVLGNKGARLVDFIKFDSALSRDQNIEVARVGTLGNIDDLDLSSGVVVRKYAPERRLNTS